MFYLLPFVGFFFACFFFLDLAACDARKCEVGQPAMRASVKWVSLRCAQV
jgi:hypothetical protein